MNAEIASKPIKTIPNLYIDFIFTPPY